MSDQNSIEGIVDTVKTVVEQELAPAHVVDLRLWHDLDHDNDPILRVEIIVEIPADGLDASKVRSLVRHLREPLGNFRDTGFPVISFITPEEFEPEAA